MVLVDNRFYNPRHKYGVIVRTMIVNNSKSYVYFYLGSTNQEYCFSEKEIRTWLGTHCILLE